LWLVIVGFLIVLPGSIASYLWFAGPDGSGLGDVFAAVAVRKPQFDSGNFDRTSEWLDAFSEPIREAGAPVQEKREGEWTIRTYDPTRVIDAYETVSARLHSELPGVAGKAVDWVLTVESADPTHLTARSDPPGFVSVELNLGATDGPPGGTELTPGECITVTGRIQGVTFERVHPESLMMIRESSRNVPPTDSRTTERFRHPFSFTIYLEDVTVGRR
jgi:hypothetical protein